MELTMVLPKENNAFSVMTGHDLASIGEMTLLSAVTALKEKLNAPLSKKLYFRANANRKTWDKRLASPIMTRSPFRR